MPLLDGYDAIRRFKADETLQAIPIIAITGFDLPEQQGEVEKAGGDGYLEKPISQEILIAQILRFLPHSTPGKRHKTLLAEEPGTGSPAPRLISQLPGLIDILEGRFSQRWESIRQTFFLDEIHRFSEEIRDLGQRYPLNLLKDWGDKLSKEVERYDMQQVAKILGDFPGLLEKIKELVEPEDEKREE